MSIEGLWSVSFASNLPGGGNGVVIFETGRVFGGDSNFYYTGSYSIKSPSTLECDLRIRHFAGSDWSVFGPATDFELVIAGNVENRVISASGYVKQQPEKQIMFRLERLADLP